MSWFTSTPITCPRCQEAFIGHAADTINIRRVPRARDLVLAGEFHVETCPACALRITIDRTFLYTDFGRRHFLQVFRRAQAPGWQRCEATAFRTFAEGFVGAPPAIQQVARTCAVRAVFGLAELAEKLRVWEAGLDDALVELLKLELVTQGTGEVTPDHEVLMQTADESRIELMVRPRDAGEDAEVTVFSVDRARYAALEAERARLEEQWPGLFNAPYVSFRRLAREPAAALDWETP